MTPARRRRVVTTRDEPGELDRRLIEAGVEVIHVPLIEIADADGSDLVEALARLDSFAWLVVTSRHGARRVGGAAAAAPHVRLACVGTRTATELANLAGRDVDVTPARQTGAGLVTAMPEGHGGLVLLAQADLADDAVSAGLAERGYSVTTVVAYRTLIRTPTRLEREAMASADAVIFASGSSAIGWAAAMGDTTPPLVITIGPTTAEAARRSGLQVTHVAADHSVEGLVAEVVRAFSVDS
jgi:uroporphyrinogen-III synthase